MPVTRVVCSNRVVTDHLSPPRPASIEIDENGKVLAVDFSSSKIEYPSNVDILNVEDLVVMPALVDAHVHINEPGRTQWEGFETATAAAAGGGCTTIIDMPLNSIPPTTTVENLNSKTTAAKGQCYVDVGFYGGVIPGNQSELRPLLKAGVRGFKCFMIESGVDEFPHVVESDIRKALQELQGTGGCLMFHAEMTKCEHCTGSSDSDPKLYQTFLDSRPKTLENDAIELVINLCREYQVHCHIVHLSSSDALPMIRKAKEEKLPLTVETCFHYLCFVSEHIPSGSTEYKCCPPIRETSNRELLWQGLLDGTIDFVVSDHSPCTANLKNLELGDFMKAWGGIASVQFGLSILWDEGSRRGLQITDLVKWISWTPAKQVGIHDRKGKIAPGYDADFVIWNPDEKFQIKRENVLFRNKVTPYAGMELRGVVHKTLLRGQIVFDRSAAHPLVSKPSGRLIL